MIEDKLTYIRISGYKSLKDVELEPGNINIFIGANGSGKSNFISFFRMLSYMLEYPGNLQNFIAERGGANKLLFNGSEFTDKISASLKISAKDGQAFDEYEFSLKYAADDTLFFEQERSRFYKTTYQNKRWTDFGSGHREAKLLDYGEKDNVFRILKKLFTEIKVYQFHNTSFKSKIRNKSLLSEAPSLKEDGANLPSVLYYLKINFPKIYNQILSTVRLVLPTFKTFVLEPEYKNILLKWKETTSEYVFYASQASDGFLRAIALITLLFLPDDLSPKILFIDEPELGLHPYAISVIAELIQAKASTKQIFIATQSADFINFFEPQDIIIVEKDAEGATTFKKISSAELNIWLEDYTLSDLWKKNFFGGLP